jgi:hypothetical protein
LWEKSPCRAPPTRGEGRIATATITLMGNDMTVTEPQSD